jgi:hypothetical protein
VRVTCMGERRWTFREARQRTLNPRGEAFSHFYCHAAWGPEA